MSWSDFDIAGFMPDLPANTPGAVFEVATPATYSYGFYPTASGFHNGPYPEITSTTGGTSGAIDTISLGSAAVFKTDGTVRVFIGTAAKLWEWNLSTTITDRSDTTYSATTTNTWSFCQFGDVTLATNLGNILRQIGAGAAFAAVGAAPTPKASIIVTCGPTSAPFVMAFDYDDGTNQHRDGWFNSGLSDPISGVGAWTTGTNGCANGRLLDDLPGPITAAIAFRDGVIAFKPSGMYLGSYSTAISNAWSWERISRDIGCLGKNCVVSADDAIYFADAKGIWMYDGAFPKRVPGYVHKWWADNVVLYAATAATRSFAKLVWDKNRRNLWCFLPFATGAATNCVGAVYHVDSQKWMPWAGFTNAAATAVAMNLIAIPNTGGLAAAYIDSNKKIGILNYAASGSDPPAAIVNFGVIGSNAMVTQMSGLRLVPTVAPASTGAVAACAVVGGNYWRNSTGVVGSNFTFATNGLELFQDGTASGRFLQPGVQFAGGQDIEFAAQGGKINLKATGDN